MTVTSFAELSQTVAVNWKSADKETKDYCVEVSCILKERHTELTKVGGIGCLSAIDSISQGLREEATPRNADSEASDTGLAKFGAIFCLPEELDSVSTGPKNDMERRNVILNATYSTRGDDSLNHTTINMPQPVPSGVIQETNLTASMPIMTGNTVSQTGTDQQDVQHQFHTIMNASRRASFSNMMTLPGSAMSQTGTYHRDVQHQFHAIMNASRRTSISNMMTLPGSAMSQTGTYHRDVQQQFHAILNANRKASIPNMMTSPGSAMSQTGTYHQDVQLQFHAIMNANKKTSISNMMTLPGRAPMPHGIRGFGQQPSPINRRYSPPEYQNPSEFDRSRAIYDIQEVDVADSNILDMWGSIKVRELDEF